MSGAVMNVTALLTGNASGMVSSFGMGSEAAKKFKDAYAATGAQVAASSKEIQAALEQEAAAAQTASAKAAEAVGAKARAAELAAAQVAVAADKEAAAHAKAAAAATAASEAAARAAQTGSAADMAAADAQAAASDRAANAATLASAQKTKAVAAAADAQKASTAAISESLLAEQAAQEKAAAAADVAAAQKKAASEASMGVINKVALGATAALAVVAVGSLDMAGKFEKSTQLLMTAGGESQANMQKVRDGILQVSQSTGVGAEQLSEGMYTVEKATYRGAAGLDVLKAAAEGAAAENVDMGTMTNALTSIMMSYHLTSDKAVATTNELVAGAGAAKTTMQNYAASLSSVLPVASAAGISFEQVGGAIATLTQHGTSADESTQELANTIRSLQAPNSVAVSAMQQLGLSATDVAQNLGKRGLTGTIEMITDAIQSHLGPAGTVIVNAMKESATGSADLQTMLSKMPASLRTSAQGFLDGTVSMKDFQKEFKSMGAAGDAQGQQFLALAKTVNGYNDQIKQGGPAAQTAAAALKAIMGGATGMNTALMLGGENMTVFKEKTQEMADAAAKSGADISTNAATQETLAATTARVKATFEALTIELGNQLMPVVKDVLNGFLSMVKFFEQNKGAAEALGLGVAALVGGFIAASLAVKAWAAMQAIASAATALLTGDFTAMSAALDANPISLVVMALAALVAGVIWAYNNIGWFKDGVDAAFKFIQQVIGNVVNWFQNSFVPWIQAVWTTTTKIFKDSADAIGAVATWLWKNIIQPAWDGIVTAGKIAFVAISTLVFTPLMLIYKAYAAIVTWLWKNIVEPAWHEMQVLMQAAWIYLNDNVFKPIGLAVQILGDAWTWYWKNIVVPVWNAIRQAFIDGWNFINDTVFQPFGRGLGILGDAFTWVWRNVIAPAWQGIRDLAGGAWSWIRDSVFSPFHQGISAIGDAFDATQKFIGTAWGKIRDAASAPVKWIVNTVYTNGIEAVWNNIANAVGLSLKLPDARLGFATGGIMPGWSPGRDNQMIAVSGGEAIMRPEWTAAVGANKIHAMNAMARSGNTAGIQQVMGFADGGIFGFFQDVAGSIGSFLSNPVSAIQNLIQGPVNSLLNQVPGGNLGKMLAQLPINLVSHLFDHSTPPAPQGGFAGDSGSFGGGGGFNGTGTGGAQQWAGTVLQALQMMGQPASLLQTTLRRMNQESGGNPNAINNWDSNAAAGIPSKGLMQVIGPTFAANAMPGYNTNIYDPMSNILASMHYAIGRYGSLAAAYNQPGGYAMGGIAPTLFDHGGYLPVGTSMVQNNTGRPERVVGPGQTGLENTTIVLEIPELGGRLTAKIKDVVTEGHGDMNRSLRNSPGVPPGGF